MIGRPRVSPLVAAHRLAAVFGVSCGQVQTAGTEQAVTIRMSTGFPTGNFRPFSEALVKGYAQLMPDIRIQQIDTTRIAGQHSGARGRHHRHRTVAGRHRLHGLQRTAAPVGARDARDSRHRDTELLRGATARRSSLAYPLDGRTGRPPRGCRAPTAAAPRSSLRRCCEGISRQVTCMKWSRPCRRRIDAACRRASTRHSRCRAFRTKT